MASLGWRPSWWSTAHTSTRSVLAIVASTLSAALAVGMVVATTTVAYAGPSVAEMEKQLDAAWNKLEPVIEKHNEVRATLAAKRKQADALQKKIEPLALQVDLAMTRVGAFAAESYKSGGTSTFNALLSSGSPTAFADRLTLLDGYAKKQQDIIRDVVDLKAKYDGQKKPLDALVNQLTNAEADLAGQQKQIDAEIKRLQALRLKAYGTSGVVGKLRLAACPYEYIGGPGGAAAKFACSQIGKPYKWAAEGPNSYDCSGLMLAAWAKVGVSLPHNALQQSRTVPAVSRSELRPGDLVFYYSDVHHVGMYVGGGWVVHAPTTGDYVRMKRIDDGPIHSYGRPG